MQTSRWITTVDTHTDGEPTRIITGGLPPLRGATMLERLDDFPIPGERIATCTSSVPGSSTDRPEAPEHARAWQCFTPRDGSP